MTPALQANPLPSEPPRKPVNVLCKNKKQTHQKMCSIPYSWLPLGFFLFYLFYLFTLFTLFIYLFTYFIYLLYLLGTRPLIIHLLLLYTKKIYKNMLLIS